jgi:uncharacterized protein YydD (DUF2326 family)
MFIKSLKIEDRTSVIRDISFYKGINLIVDETQSSDKRSSGNNVGKTTVLRLIDFCLGGSGANIYKDTEFRKKTHTEIQKFLVDNQITITLVLKEDLEVASSTEITLRKNFLSRKLKIQEVNGENILNNRLYEQKLKQLLFHSATSKPTFRQIVSKNIRDEKYKLLNTVRVLHPSTTQEAYEALYLFWLGIDINVSDKKQQLSTEKKLEETLQQKLSKDSSLSQIEQSLLVVNDTIEELTKKKNSFNLNQSYEADINSLNEAKSELNKLSTELSRLELRRELINESKQDLEAEFSKIDAQQVSRLYEEARILIPHLQKTYEETLYFHNQMIGEKIKYITEELPSLDAEIVRLKNRVNKCLLLEKQFTEKLIKAGAIEEVQQVIFQLTSISEKKGGLEELRKLWVESNRKLESIESALKSIDEEISSKDSLIQERIAEFNKYFSAISSRLYNEQFVLSSDKNEKGYELNISSLSGNLGTGKKKGQIAAFDLAYIQFADSLGIRCLHFVLHDQIENVHDNQISSLLTEIVNSINCQYILPVLKDKLPKDLDIHQCEILVLSQTDKLLKF